MTATNAMVELVKRYFALADYIRDNGDFSLMDLEELGAWLNDMPDGVKVEPK